MKNEKLIYTLILTIIVILKSCGQSHDESGQCCNSINLSLPYNTHSTSNDFLGNTYLEKNLFPAMSDVTTLLFSRGVRNNFSKEIGSFVDNSICYTTYLKVTEDDYGSFVYEQWIKSKNNKGIKIDSLQLVIYTSYDGIQQRMFSKIVTSDRIEFEHQRLEWDLEKDDPNDLTKVKKIQGNFLIKEGKFIYKNALKNPVFIEGNSFGDLFSHLDKDCFSILKQQLLDINMDGIQDAIYFLKAKNRLCNNGKKTDLAICLADNHGLFTFKGTENFYLDDNKFDLGFKLYDRGLLIEVTKKNNKQKSFFYCIYHEKIKRWSLERIEVRDDKNSLISKKELDTSSYIPIQEILKYLEK